MWVVSITGGPGTLVYYIAVFSVVTQQGSPAVRNRDIACYLFTLADSIFFVFIGINERQKVWEQAVRSGLPTVMEQVVRANEGQSFIAFFSVNGLIDVVVVVHISRIKSNCRAGI